MTKLSTQERNIAQVFQFPVIYDTMTVYDNLAFPLRNRGVPEAEVDRKVREILDMIGLADRADKRARGLTADQKQKISLGRGLVRSDVNAILFDEPLTVIDPHMKWVLRSQLKQLHRRFGYTMVYVTHDQTEALTFADQVVVMYEGEHRADRHAGRAVRAPQAHFRRLFHRLAGHERHAGLDRRQDGEAWRADDRAAGRAGRQHRRRSSSASGRNMSGSAARACRSPCARSRISAARRSCAPASKAARSRRSSARTRTCRPTRRCVFDPAGINLYAGSWRVEMGA